MWVNMSVKKSAKKPSEQNKEYARKKRKKNKKACSNKGKNVRNIDSSEALRF